MHRRGARQAREAHSPLTMPTVLDLILQANREFAHGSQEKAFGLLCTVARIQQEQAVQKDARVRRLEAELAALKRTW
jgi:hypothetical protein